MTLQYYDVMRFKKMLSFVFPIVVGAPDFFSGGGAKFSLFTCASVYRTNFQERLLHIM
jgi:hypothetical protein